MDRRAVALHAAEPGVLAFGEAPDFAAEFLVQVVLVVDLAAEIPRDMAVLQPQLFQAAPGAALRHQIFHFLDESRFHAAPEAMADSLAQLFTVPLHPQHQGVDFRGRFRRGDFFVEGNLDGPLQAVPLQQIGGVVKIGLDLPQFLFQAFRGHARHFGPKCGVFRYGRHKRSGQDGFQIQPGAAGDDGQLARPDNAGKGRVEIALVPENIVFRVQVDMVNEVIADGRAAQFVFFQVLARADVQTAIDLAGVGRNDFPVQQAGQGDAQGGFSGRGGAKDKQGVEGGHREKLSGELGREYRIWTCMPENCNNDPLDYTPDAARYRSNWGAPLNQETRVEEMKNIHQIREISTISFNERVLQEAEDGRNPLLERLRFLGIFSSNMDELFKVRVASIHRRIELGKKGFQEILDLVNERARGLDERFRAAYKVITEELARKGIHIITEEELAGDPDGLETWLRTYFRAHVLPGLVPLICHKSQPFPQLTDGALYLAVVMRGKRKRYAILEIPPELPRFVELPNGITMYVDDVIRHNLNEIFYIFAYDAIDAYEFKVSRDAQLDIDNDFTDGYVRKMERVLKQRKGGRPTRLVYDAGMPKGFRKMLLNELHIDEEDTLIPGGRYHNMKDLFAFPAKRDDLLFEKLDALPHPVLEHEQTPMLDSIRRQDLLITYPYQSFGHVIRLLREAAIDPHVSSISMTLYRSANNSQVVKALYNAAQNGKKIFVSIELQARFDEENNIHIAEKLSEVGAKVVYGVPPLKVHSKLLLIERKKRLYAGLSTGNFNETTGRLYVDSILLTSDRRLTGEVAEVFHYLDRANTVRTTTEPKFKQLLVSPFNSRKEIMALLDREEKKGNDGYVLLKVNHLTDPGILDKLSKLADAGVSMDFIVRTTYAMKPHENIRAISILDRYLEHQRVYIFGTGADQKVYLSSADLMERNLDWRVEAAFPILDPELRRQVAEMMQLQTRDNSKARYLDETQSNPYVGRSRNGTRAQEATRAYLAQLLETASPVAVGDTA